jgi:class 3 adenylate cyclase
MEESRLPMKIVRHVPADGCGGEMMDFYEVLDQIIDLLQQRGKLTYRVLKLHFNLDDDTLVALKDELLFSHSVVDATGHGLVWTGAVGSPEPDARPRTADARPVQALLPAVMAWLRQEGRVTYHAITDVFGIDDTVLEALRDELTFKQLARDEDGKGLVWTGETQPMTPPTVSMPRFPAAAETTIVTAPAASSRPTATPEALSADLPQDEPIVSELTHRAPEAERRHLTVMFCDLADSTKLAQELDPEDLRDVIRAYQATAAAVIQQYDGHIAQYLGDGVLIYFGWPRAHEDDAQRALHTGLGLVEALTTTLNPRLAQEKGIELTVRVGIHTGPVVVGTMGAGTHMEHLATGDTVNIAARLEALAAPNTVVLSPVTAHLVEGVFALEDVGTHVLKGVSEPMPVFRVLRALARPGDEDDATPAGGVFLVGRDEEVGVTQAVLGAVQSGIGPGSVAQRCSRDWQVLTGNHGAHVCRAGWAYPHHLSLLALSYQQCPLSGDHTPGTEARLGA